ncbi:hypothetical protein LJR231_001537 [Phyllobacterium sp. LjRoot231]|uniref:hypothetical protein n=1 Tax=Phyllobacterium sp. LjRoot231 TaxID=3342289 RepID=UPI003ECFAE3E
MSTPAVTKTEQPAISRTTAGLRDAIFDEIDAIRNGTSNPTRANAVAKLATGIVETVRMEIEVQKHLKLHAAPMSQAPHNSFLGAPMPLGSS